MKRRTTAIIRGLVEIGQPFPVPTATPPENCLSCNGAAFDGTIYPLLLVKYPDGKTPDLRAEFLRGWDNGRGVDNGRALLSTQGDAIRNITGSFYARPNTASNVSGGVYGGNGVIQTVYGNAGSATPALSGSGDGWNGSTTSFDASRQVPTASENRPRSVAFHYVVRAR